MMRSSGHHQQRGSVVLVALCFLAVLGIALASYLAVSNQAMKLSNRSYQQSISAQLAEIGIEDSLWAFNHNNWDPSVWTILGTTASRTITFSSNKYGNGVTGTINLRVYNYNAPISATPWNSTIPHNVNDVVSYNRTSTWNPATAYNINDVVVSSTGFKYTCILAHTGQSPPNSTYWAGTSAFTDFRSWYRCISNSSGTAPPHSIYWVNSIPIIYSEGVATPLPSSGAASKTQLRALISTATLFPNAAGANLTLTLNAAPNGTVDSYTSDSDSDAATPATNYPGASYDNFSAILAGENTPTTAVTVVNTSVKGYVAAPPSASFPNAPLFSYGGSTTLKGPSSGSAIDLTRVSRSPLVPQFDPTTWDPATGYRLSDIVRASDGKLYMCTAPHINQQPPNVSYWTDGGAPLIVSSGTVPIGTAGSPTPTLYHLNGDLSLSATTDILEIDGPVILDISGNISITGGKILVMANGSAEILFSGQLQVDNTGGGIDNTQTKDPKKLLLVNTNSSATAGHYFNSSIKFYGTMYMPNCSLTINPPTSPPGAGIYGAVSANNITFLSRLGLHYDTSVRTTTFHSIDMPYVVTEWRELTDPAERIALP